MVDIKMLRHQKSMVGKLIGYTLTFAGALFNQLTLYMAHWRRNYLHKNGIRVKVRLLVKNKNFYFIKKKKKNFLQLYILVFENEYAFPC